MQAFITVTIISLIIFAILFFSILLFTYLFVFCHPKCIRPNPRIIPSSPLYNVYKEALLNGVNDMDSNISEELSITSFDGHTLYAKYYDFNTSSSDTSITFTSNSPVVIFFHGYHGVSYWDGYGTYHICKTLGFRLIMVDMRAHGKSSGNISLGLNERFDCVNWVNYAVSRFGSDCKLILSGVSMGAVSVMMSTSLKLPENICGIIADCGYTKPSLIVKETIKNMRLPVEPTYALVKLSAHIFGRINLDTANAIDSVYTLKIPILFIHGTKDSIVPVSMCSILHENCHSSNKSIALIEEADHANSALVDYAAYEKAVTKFINTIVV